MKPAFVADLDVCNGMPNRSWEQREGSKTIKGGNRAVTEEALETRRKGKHDKKAQSNCVLITLCRKITWGGFQDFITLSYLQ